MPFTIIQAGDTLQFVDTDGGLSDLTLPSDVELRTDTPPRFAIYNNYVVMVNTPDRPLTIDATGTVRPLTPKPPVTPPTVATGSSGSLSGTYSGIRYTYIIKDAEGFVISESDYSPASGSVTVAAQKILVSGISTSTEDISARRIYRPTTGGATLFQWFDLEGNTVTSAEDDLGDAGLALIASPILGNPPRLTLIKEWRNLLWGVGDVDVDTLVFTRPEAFYSWPATNTIPVPGAGRDVFGVRALMPRREALGVGRRDIIWQVVGESVDDFRVVKLSENTGVESQESVVVYRDTVFWLWKDGVYQWDAEGMRNISDLNVGSWFKTNNFFNRNMFSEAFAVMDPVRLKYRLFLAAAGSSVIDRWVEYDLNSKTWWGPHKTLAFSPKCAFLLSDENDKVEAITGSVLGHIWQDQTTATDDVYGIELDVDTKFFDGSTPDLEKHWGELSVVGKAQSRGVLRITPKTGYLDSSDQAVIPYDMTKGRQVLRRIGNGKLMQLNFQHNTIGEDVEIYGFQLPYHILGRR